jgi:hypothetical protein
MKLTKTERASREKYELTQQGAVRIAAAAA